MVIVELRVLLILGVVVFVVDVFLVVVVVVVAAFLETHNFWMLQFKTYGNPL